MQYEIAGQSSQDSEVKAANTSRLLNVYRERILRGGRTEYLLRDVLGQDAKDSIGADAVRAMGRANGKNWLTGAGSLFEVSADGTLTNRGTIADDEETNIAGNQTITTVTAGGNYYVWDGSAISEPTTLAFTEVGSHCFVGGYTVITERGGNRFQWSAIGNAESLNALHFARADTVDDNIVRAVEFAGNLLLFCETSVEVWSPTGLGNERAFSRVTTRNTGLLGFNLLVRFDDALFFVGNDGIAYLYGEGRASSAAVNNSIQNKTPTHCFYYEDEGHKHCVVRFSDRPAWVFDLSEREWHERGEGAGFQHWSATCSLRNGTSWLVGSDEGNVSELARTSLDRGGPLYRRVIGYNVYTGRKFSPKKLELVAEVGEHDLSGAIATALTIAPGVVLEIATDTALRIATTPAGPRDAFISLYESGDGGKTWRGPYERSMGASGEFSKRMTWRQRGQYQQYTPRFDYSDPTDVILYATGVLE